jgi:hypothetical protein
MSHIPSDAAVRSLNCNAGFVERVSAEPFESAEQAWFWTVTTLAARRNGVRNGAAIERPCEPDDILKCLDRLYRTRRIELLHGRILRIYGERQIAPSPGRRGELCDWRLWNEAMERLEAKLRVKGIVR